MERENKNQKSRLQRKDNSPSKPLQELSSQELLTRIDNLEKALESTLPPSKKAKIRISIKTLETILSRKTDQTS